jgi:hypothetical protein
MEASMCGSFDPKVTFTVCVALALLGALLTRRVRGAIDGENGFTVGEASLLILVIALLAAAVAAAMLWCYTKPGPQFGIPIPLPAGAVQTGAAAPANAPPPSCQIGAICKSAGKICGRNKTCVDTFEWDTASTLWLCGCECR